MATLSGAGARLTAFAALFCVAFGQYSREKFPADEPFDDATLSTYKPYIKGVVIFTFGAGIGLAILIWLLMICCCFINCCRGPGAKQKTSNALYSSFQKFDSQTHNTKALLIGLAVIVFIQLVCAAGIYVTMGETNTYVLDFYEGGQDLTVDFAGFLCSTEKTDDSTDCTDDTIGDFLEDAKVAINDGFDEMVDWLESLDSVLDALDDVDDAVAELSDTAELLQQQVNWFDGNSTIATATVDELSDPSQTGGAEFSNYLPDSSDVPTLGEGTIDNINDGIDSLVETTDTLSDLEEQLTDILNDEVNSVIERIDGEGDNDDRSDVINTLDDLLGNVHDSQDNVLDVDADMEDYKDKVEDGLEKSRHAATILFAIPGLLMLLVSTWTWKTKSGQPLRVNMVCNFFCQEFCAIVTGLMMLSAIIVTDICDSHVQVIEVNLNKSVSIGDSTVILGDVVMDVLRCSGDENLAEILGVVDEFNVSSYVQGSLDEIDSTISSFDDQFDDVQQVMDDAEAAVNSLTDISIEGNYTAGTIVQINALLDALPLSPFTDSTDDNNKLQFWYGDNYDLNDPTEKNEAIAENDDNVADLNTLKTSLLNLDSLAIQIDNSIDEIGEEYNVTVEAIANLTTSLDDAVAGLGVVEDGLQTIVDFVATGPEYLGCAFIGDFYSDTIEGTMCTDLEQNLNLLYIPMLVLTIFILIGFCFSGFFTPYMKKDQANASTPQQVHPAGVSPHGDLELLQVHRGSGRNSDEMMSMKADRVV